MSCIIDAFIRLVSTTNMVVDALNIEDSIVEFDGFFLNL